MNDTYRPASGQVSRFACIGCMAGLTLGAPAMGIQPPRGRLALVCMACADRAMADDQHRQRLEACAAAGVPFPKAERLFVSVGVFEVPTTAEGIAEAFGVTVDDVRALGGCS